jgi:alpha-tubulin suppressor-like RCC1 family protein
MTDLWGNKKKYQPSEELRDVVAIAVNFENHLALKRDGTVVDWTTPPIDEFGATHSPRPVESVPAGLTDVQAIAVGFNHSLALKRNGTVVAWGEKERGQLNVPTGLSDVVAISAGCGLSIALKRDGTVVTWGNQYGNIDLAQLNMRQSQPQIVNVTAGDLRVIAIVQ